MLSQTVRSFTFSCMVAIGLLGLMAAPIAAKADVITVDVVVNVTVCVETSATCQFNAGDQIPAKFSYDDTSIPSSGPYSVDAALVAPTELWWNDVVYDETNSYGFQFDFFDGVLQQFYICSSPACGVGSAGDWALEGKEGEPSGQDLGYGKWNFRGVGTGYEVQGLVPWTIGCCTLSVAISADGIIESKAGGFKFPDGTVQTTAVGYADIIPWASSTYDLGSLNNRWRQVHATDLISQDLFSQSASISDVLSLGPGSPPTDPQIGDIYVDADTNELCFWNGAWQALVTGIAGNCN